MTRHPDFQSQWLEELIEVRKKAMQEISDQAALIAELVNGRKQDRETISGLRRDLAEARARIRILELPEYTSEGIEIEMRSNA